MVYNCECHFPIGILGQVWYLIVSIPDLCTLTYFQRTCLVGELSCFRSISESTDLNMDFRSFDNDNRLKQLYEYEFVRE